MTDQFAAPISFSVKGAVQASGLSRSKIYELIRAGQLDARKQQGRTLVMGDSLRAYLRALPPLPRDTSKAA